MSFIHFLFFLRSFSLLSSPPFTYSPRYTSALPSWPPSPSPFFAGPFSSFPRICRQFGAPDGFSREKRHTAAPTVPSHFEKYLGKMIRPLLRPGLPPSPALSEICPHLVFWSLFYFLVSLSREPTAHLPQFLSPPLSLSSSSPASSSSHRIVSHRGPSWQFFFLPRNARCALDVIVLSCFRAVSDRGKLAATVLAKRYGRVRPR